MPSTLIPDLSSAEKTFSPCKCSTETSTMRSGKSFSSGGNAFAIWSPIETTFALVVATGPNGEKRPRHGEIPGDLTEILGDSPEYWSGSVNESESGRSSDVRFDFSGIESKVFKLK